MCIPLSFLYNRLKESGLMTPAIRYWEMVSGDGLNLGGLTEKSITSIYFSAKKRHIFLFI